MKLEILQLYPEDFVSENVWIEVCDVCQIPHDAPQIIVEFVRTGTSEETLKERE